MDATNANHSRYAADTFWLPIVLLASHSVWGAGKSAEDKGFEPSTGFPAPDFESGS
jgi:hypothetical protein